MTGRVFRILLLLCVIALFCKACIVRDVQPKITSEVKTSASDLALSYSMPKNVTINGIDYLQSQAPVGIFGGTLVSSTIGEGPKTFNPFNCKDNTSAIMSGVMYDGLFTTNPVTGEVAPKLAKGYTISPDGKVYTIYLRHGIKWSDGKPITADDVVFTWQNIIFAGLGDTSTRDSLVINGKLPTVRKYGEDIVVFVTPEPYAPFLRMLSTSIAPKHVFYNAVQKGSAYFDSFLSTCKA